MSTIKPNTCEICNKSFRNLQDLKRHGKRKTSCAPILDLKDLPENKQHAPKCRFCGKAFKSLGGASRHMRNNCKIAPRDGNTEGMDILYDHILKKQQRQIDEQKIAFEKAQCAHQQELHALKQQIVSSSANTEEVQAASCTTNLAAVNNSGLAKTNIEKQAASSITNSAAINNGTILAKTNVGYNTGVVDASTKNFYINIFGKENTDHITSKDIYDILKKLEPHGSDLKKVAELAITRTAMLMFSDKRHPENITCYISNKKGREALVHGAEEWEIQPTNLVMSTMALQAVDTIFKKQPFNGVDGVPDDAKIEECGKLLRFMIDHEGDLTTEPSADLRAIPIRNKGLLERVLKHLPAPGDA